MVADMAAIWSESSWQINYVRAFYRRKSTNNDSSQLQSSWCVKSFVTINDNEIMINSIERKRFI